MPPDAIVTLLRSAAEEWPLGALVRHRASGLRGVVSGYVVLANSVLVRVDYANQSVCNEWTGVLRADDEPDDNSTEDTWKGK